MSFVEVGIDRYDCRTNPIRKAGDAAEDPPGVTSMPTTVDFASRILCGTGL